MIRDVAAACAIVTALVTGFVAVRTEARKRRARTPRGAVAAWAAGQVNRLESTSPTAVHVGIASDHRSPLLPYYESGRLYIKPPFETLTGPAPTQRLLEYVTGRITRGERILVRAESGQGKSLFMQLLYLELLRKVIAEPATARIPLLLPLGQCDVEHGAGRDMRQHFIERYAYAYCRLPEALQGETGTEQFVLLLDGLDELKLVSDDPAKTNLLLTGVIAAADVVTTREGFIGLRLSTQTVSQLAEQIRLLPLTFDEECKTIIRAYCAEVGGDAAAIIEHIEATPRLVSAIARPLVLFMTIEIFAHTPADELPRVWTATRIYGTYLDLWLRREQDRGGSLLSAQVKWTANEQLAWETFRLSEHMSHPYGASELKTVVVDEARIAAVIDGLMQSARISGDRDKLITDLRDHTCLTSHDSVLAGAGGTQYGFAHKSFFEYFLATHVVGLLSSFEVSRVEIAHLLEVPFPNYVVGFIRGLLSDLASDGGDSGRCCASNLLMVLDDAVEVDVVPLGEKVRMSTMSPSHVVGDIEMARQQAANLLPLLTDDEETVELIARTETEGSFLVRRGLAVGLALHRGVCGPLEEYVRLMDGEAAGAVAAHIGYSRIYYGDQARTGGWADDLSKNCAGLYVETLAQLADPEKYASLGCMTVFTLRWLLDSARYLGEDGVVRSGAEWAITMCAGLAGRSLLTDQQITDLEGVVAQRWRTPRSA